MNYTNNIPTNEQLRSAAREKAVQTLKGIPVYRAMSVPEQRDIYLSLVNEYLDNEKVKYGLTRSMATDSGKEMGFKGYDPSFQGNTRSFEDLVESVDFPLFVKDLLKAVFDANIVVMKQQTDSYIKLMKEATKSTADFIKKIKDEDAFARLAESRGDMYNVITEKNADGSTKLALTNPEGDKADPEDDDVKKHILEAKIGMAKEHRAALREVLLMGVTRLVVEKGEVDAAVEFTIRGFRQSNASHSDQNINVNTLETEYGGGLFGSMFGGPSGTLSNVNTNIQVNTSDKKATDEMTAKLTGHVNIKFKTDYFKLDNFASMYADGGIAALQPQPQPNQLPLPNR